MTCLGSFFSLCRQSPSGAQGSFLRPLSRRHAQELVLLACLAPILTSNVAADFSDSIYCSDASNAYCVAKVGLSFASALWASADKKGHYTRLTPATCSGTRGLVATEHENEEGHLPGLGSSYPPRPSGLDYDFVKVCGGSGRVSKADLGLGLKVGPVIDLSVSKQEDPGAPRVIEWLLHMITP